MVVAGGEFELEGESEEVVYCWREGTTAGDCECAMLIWVLAMHEVLV